jgi:hypothetical protein
MAREILMSVRSRTDYDEEFASYFDHELLPELRRLLVDKLGMESVSVVSVRGLPDYDEYRDGDPPDGPPPWEQAERVFVVGVPLAGIELTMVASTKAAYGRYDGGRIASQLVDGRESAELQAALRAVELVVLSHALNGIDVRAPVYVAGLSTAVLGLSERYG